MLTPDEKWGRKKTQPKTKQNPGENQWKVVKILQMSSKPALQKIRSAAKKRWLCRTIHICIFFLDNGMKKKFK